MTGTANPLPPRSRSTGPFLCLLATGLASLLPPLAGFIMDQVTAPQGPLGELYSLLGAMAGLVLGPVVLLLSVIVLVIQDWRWGKST